MSKELTKEFCKLPLTQQELIVVASVGYELLNQQEKLFKTRRDKMLRPIVESAADNYGIEDPDGHKHLIMDDGEEFQVEVVRQKKVSRIMNTVAAEKLLKKKGIYDSCVVPTITYDIDEGKLIEAYNAGILSAGELDGIFTEKVSWATIVHTDDPKVEGVKELRLQIEKGENIKEMPEIESNTGV